MAMYGFDKDIYLPDNFEGRDNTILPHICDVDCASGCARKFIPSYIPRWARPHYALFPNSPLSCPMCYNDIDFKSEEELDMHTNICPITDKVLNNFQEGIEINCRVRKVHPVGDHQSMIVQYEDCPIFETTSSCPVCGIGAQSLDMLLDHLNLHRAQQLCNWYYICTSCYKLSNNCHNYSHAIRHYAKDHGSVILKMKQRDFFARHLKKEFEEFMATAEHEYVVHYP